MPIIKQISARWILDSRGIPTISCHAIISDTDTNLEFRGKSSVPSGASTGIHEALELRDLDQTKFNGKGVNKAINNLVNIIGTSLIGKEFDNAKQVDEFVLSLEYEREMEIKRQTSQKQQINQFQSEVDNFINKNHLDESDELDELEINTIKATKSVLGANAILAVSMAIHRSFAASKNLELWEYLRYEYFSDCQDSVKFPRLMCNIFNGGAHASNNLNIQEFMIIPNGQNIESDVQIASEIYHKLKQILKNQNQSTSVGDEGGFAPDYNGSREVLKIMKIAAQECGYSRLNYDLGLDCAASEFYSPETKTYSLDGVNYSQSALADFMTELSQDFDLLSIEDPFAEDDLLGWELLTTKIGKKRILIGDDLFTTNANRFSKMILNRSSNSNTDWSHFNFETVNKNNIANGVLIKPNQIGTILETSNMINLAKKCSYSVAVSHRSGETDDDFIADLAFACQSEFIKLGAPARGERVAKYNRLLEIFEQLNTQNK